ncbi:MAG: J domain-containing protein [Pirellulaceae bacterium]
MVNSVAIRLQSRNPFDVLGLSADADEKAIRERYLQLVKKYPPERDPDAFQKIQNAFELVKDPLALADYWLDLPSPDSIPQWSDVIAEQASQPPDMSVEFVLSLGNRKRTDATEHHVRLDAAHAPAAPHLADSEDAADE